MKHLTQIAYDWAVRCFGSTHVHDRRIRALRLTEEALKLSQSCGVNATQLHKLIDYVYSEPSGDVVDEMGGVAITLAVMAKTFSTDPEKLLLEELTSVLDKPKDYFFIRNNNKIANGFY